MIGVIVCTHSTLADGLKNAIDMIVGTQENFDVFCFMNGDDVDELREKLDRAVEKYEKKSDIGIHDVLKPCGSAGDDRCI